MLDKVEQRAGEPIVIFDGVCGLCNRFVAFALQHDLRRELVFTPNRSEYGAVLCERLHIADESCRTIVVVDGDRILLRSDAVVFIARHLKSPYSYLALIRYVPRPLRDAGYRFVAAVRQLVPGDHTACALLPSELQRRIRESV